MTLIFFILNWIENKAYLEKDILRALIAVIFLQWFFLEASKS